jgi:acyl-CoA synthetase (AMP-forming)/AMP-acid ligase II
MTTAWQRFAYVCEFLLATIAIFDGWSQIGGQAHLDMMPWYWKLGFGCGLAAAAVGLTAAMMRERALNRRAVFWAAAVLGLMLGMAAVTYYYHLQEVIEEPATEEDTTARAQRPCGLRVSVARGPSRRPSRAPAPHRA